MRKIALAAALLLLASRAALAQPASSLFAAKRASAAYSLAVRESQTVAHPGATAAWAVDANVVDVVAQNGSITLLGRAPGRTRVIVISATGEAAFDVTVKASQTNAAQKQTTSADRGTAEVRYSSAARELQNSVTVTRESKEKRSELHVRTVHHGGEESVDRARTSVASASIRFFTRGRELTLLDREVDHSPLTLSHTPLRGIHYLDEHWRLHAGYTAYATYQSFLVPLERELVAGAGYAIRTGANSRVTPSMFAYGDGTVLSMLYEYDGVLGGPRSSSELLGGAASNRGTLGVRAEIGYSRGFGIAAQLAYASNREHARADLRYRGDDFAVASAGHPRGLLADASWSRQYGFASTLAAAAQASNIGGSRVVAASADVEHRLSERTALTGGASYGSFDGRRSITIPAGVRLDFARGGMTALYRFSQSHDNRGGHGFRLSGRASMGRASISAYVDRQEHAPTLEVIFDAHPELALALRELGIVATTPGDIARALREHAALIELGYIDGVTVELAPVRTQLGIELAFFGTTAARQQLRARLARSVIESVGGERTSTLASLMYSRRLTASTDFFAGYTWWRTERSGEEARDTPFFEAGLRQRFDSLPSLPGLGGGSISGAVFADENLDGASDGTPVVAEVELDGAQTKRTNADGTFTFTNVARGAHRVTARIPDRPDAYFTTPARVEVETGERVEFGVAYTPARLQGRVTSDAGDGIATVRVLLARGANQVIASTESNGSYAIAAAPGEWQVSLLGDSIPAGYSLAGAEARTVLLERMQPRDASWSLRAHRTVAGSGAAPNAELEVRPLGKKIRADEQGRFSIRSLPAGEITVVAGGVEHRLTLPSAPGSVQLELAPRTAAAAAPPVVKTETRGERRDSMRWMVAIGAFRIHSNAVATAARARQQGVAAQLDDSGALTVVRAGPFDSRTDAAAAADRLTEAGIEAVVVSTK